MKHEYDALLLFDSERNPEAIYAAGFPIADPFIFIRKGSRDMIVLNELEAGRAREKSKAEILSYEKYLEKAQKRTGAGRIAVDCVIDEIFRELNISRVLIPDSTPVGLADKLRQMGYDIGTTADSFFEERAVKTELEINGIAEVQAATESAMKAAIDMIEKSDIRKGNLYLDSEILTSERVKRAVLYNLIGRDCFTPGAIVSCGRDSALPHNPGSGPLRPDKPIVIDIFPQSMKTRCCGDMTRTVVRGKASPGLKEMYDAVREAKEIAIDNVREGARMRELYDMVSEYFELSGFGIKRTRKGEQGFIHGLGHGVGLCGHDIYSDPLKKGNVITIEPGLYYFRTGGVRLEDIVVVEENGCRNLNKMEELLEL